MRLISTKIKVRNSYRNWWSEHTNFLSAHQQPNWDSSDWNNWIKYYGYLRKLQNGVVENRTVRSRYLHSFLLFTWMLWMISHRSICSFNQNQTNRNVNRPHWYDHYLGYCFCRRCFCFVVDVRRFRYYRNWPATNRLDQTMLLHIHKCADENYVHWNIKVFVWFAFAPTRNTWTKIMTLASCKRFLCRSLELCPVKRPMYSNTCVSYWSMRRRTQNVR